MERFTIFCESNWSPVTGLSLLSLIRKWRCNVFRQSTRHVCFLRSNLISFTVISCNSNGSWSFNYLGWHEMSPFYGLNLCLFIREGMNIYNGLPCLQEFPGEWKHYGYLLRHFRKMNILLLCRHKCTIPSCQMYWEIYSKLGKIMSKFKQLSNLWDGIK